MMRFLFCFTMLLSSVVSAQVNMPDGFDTINGYQRQLMINAQFDFQTTSFKNEMTNKLAFGGYIDQSMKDRSLNKHGLTNFAGLISNNEITYFHGSDSIFGQSRFDWGVKAGYFALGSIKYGKDPFGLVFFGNEGYLGDTAFFSKTIFNFSRFQKLGFGMRDKQTGSYLFLNFINLQDQFSGEISKGYLYQNADASEVKMRVLGDMAYTSGNSFNKGFGASLDASVRFKVPWIKGTQTEMELTATNIGFASINSNMQYYSVDSSYAFDGFRLKELFSESSPFNRDDFDVLDSLGVVHDSTYHQTIALPGFIQAGKMIDYSSELKWQSFFGIRLYPTLKSNAAVYVGAAYKPTKSLLLIANASYGGFTTIRGGLSLGYLGDKLTLALGTDDIFGAFYKGGYGKSVYLKSVWNLK